ncbi:MAG: metallophosphoesterase family protein, partial [Verrucomicrobiota bacterium]
MNSARWAIFSDIHSNLEALTAVVDDIRQQGITQMLCLGDIVGYNANPAECLELVRRLECPVLQGNHDLLAAVDDQDRLRDFNPVAIAGVLFSRSQLSAEQKKWLAALPMNLKFAGFGAVHASLFEPEEWHYITSLFAARAHFASQDSPIYLHGHTHYPMVFTQEVKSQMCDVIQPRPDKVMFLPEYRYLINCGAVGQPRDRDPRACYGILDLGEQRFEFRRVTYDIQRAQKKIH